MAKRVILDIPGVQLNETEHRVLAMIARCARDATGLKSGEALIGKRPMAAHIGRSESCATRSIASLAAKGLIAMRPNTLGNGARLENSYRLTALGLEVLDHADAAVANGMVGVTGSLRRGHGERVAAGGGASPSRRPRGI